MAQMLNLRGAAVVACAIFLATGAPRPASAGGVYFVKQGDTLAGISRLFGVTVQDLREANSLATSRLKPGDKVRIPERAPKTQPASLEARSPDVDDDRVLQAICRQETVYHTVAAGDTLFAIARRYSTGVDDLLRLNGLKSRSRLALGQKILVRRTGPRSHSVARGETLRRIAARYRIPPAELARLNHLAGETILAGQRLLLEPCDPYAAAGSAPPPLGSAASAATDAHGIATGAAPAAGPGTAVLGKGTPASAAGMAERVIGLAKTMLDIPYRFGGTTVRGIDCSAYVQRVFGLLDVPLPRTAREQYDVGARIGRDDLAVGDLVFFRTYASFPSHVGIYLGDNLFIHASSMVRRVTIDSIEQPYYRRRFLGARRMVADDTPSLASAP
jgi:cell wall-associated NlpC family hydrolase